MIRFLVLTLLVTGCDYLEHDAQEANSRAAREIAWHFSGLTDYVGGLEQTVSTTNLHIAQLQATINVLDLLKQWQDEAVGLEDGQCRVRSTYLDHLYHDNVTLAMCCTRVVTTAQPCVLPRVHPLVVPYDYHNPFPW